MPVQQRLGGMIIRVPLGLGEKKSGHVSPHPGGKSLIHFISRYLTILIPFQEDILG